MEETEERYVKWSEMKRLVLVGWSIFGVVLVLGGWMVNRTLAQIDESLKTNSARFQKEIDRHEQRPHKGAADQNDVLQMKQDVRDLRQDMKSATQGLHEKLDRILMMERRGG